MNLLKRINLQPYLRTTYFFHIFTESREKATKLDSELEVLKIESEKQKLENEQNVQNAQRDLSSTIASLEVRQSELVERLKVSQFEHT